ncbi:hypothetical protein [Achromobacter pestifer]
MNTRCLYCNHDLAGFLADARHALMDVDARPGYCFTTTTPCCGQAVEMGRQESSLYMAKPDWRKSDDPQSLVIAGPYC